MRHGPMSASETTLDTLRARVRRVCLIVAALAIVWAEVVVFTGGFQVFLGPVRISSRNPTVALWLASIVGVVAWTLADSGARLRTLLGDATAIVSSHWVARLSRLSPRILPLAIATCISVGVVVLGLTRGALIVGGSDSYGYVSQAELWATGRLRVPQPIVSDVQWPFAADVLSPLGYRARTDGSLIPVYPPGFPLTMAVFDRLFGRAAVFWVVPLLAGVAVWATYQWGSRAAGPAIGCAAATLVATYPAFLFQLMSPMSDVPVTAWWVLALALLQWEGILSTFGSGVATGLAILTRPNLLPLLLVLGLYVLVDRRDSQGRNARLGRFGWFLLGVCPACLAVAGINWMWYGSPLVSGYGHLSDLYSWRNVTANLADYPTKLIAAQPVLLGGVAFVIWRLWQAGKDTQTRLPTTSTISVSCGLVIATFVSYAFYTPFPEWWSLRFILPCIPALSLLAACGLHTVVANVTRPLRAIAFALLVSLCACYGASYARRHSAFDLAASNAQFPTMAGFVATTLPERTAVLAMMHSGSIRYYASRLSVRYDLIPPTALDTVVGDLRRLGFSTCALLEPWESSVFRARFAGHSSLASLDWTPVATHVNGTQLFCFPGGPPAKATGVVIR